MNNRFLLAATLLLSGFSLVGCEVYDSSLIQGDASTGCAEDPLACNCPGRPPCAVEDTSDGGDSMRMTFVMTDINLDQQGEWVDIGFNLDGHVSTSENGYAGDCTPWAASSTPVATPDGNGGIDNHFGAALWPVISQTLPSLECEVNWAHDRGQGALLIEITKWNGERDDDQVTAAILPALDGTSQATDCMNWNGQVLRNALDTMDALDPDPTNGMPDNYCVNIYGRVGQNPAGTPTVQDTRAYITDNQLVVTLLPGARFELFSTRASVSIALNQGQLFARMSDDYTTIEEGFVSGRMATSTLTEVGPDIGVCTPEDFESVYRANSDALSILDDGAAGDDECDALSIGVGFMGVEANLAGDSVAAYEPFVACDDLTDTLKEPYPVFDCCSALAVSQRAVCEANTTLP